MIKHIRRFLILFLLIYANSGSAETRYITDQFEVTLRSGSSTSNSIVSMLKSGDAVTVLEQDVATKYSLVETENGKTGYVLSRFLDSKPSGRQLLASLEQRSEKLKTTLQQLTRELDEYKKIKKADEQKIKKLEMNLAQTEKELADLKQATSDTIRVIKQNEALEQRINELEAQKQQLSEQNARYKDSTQMDWFIRGAGVFLGAFLIGILVTRIRWRKNDSWGSY